MESVSTDNTLVVMSYALAIGFGEHQEPVCLILSMEALVQGGDIAITATKASLDGSDLHLHGPLGSMALKNLAHALLEALRSGLPIVVLDSTEQRETLIPAIDQLGAA
ncbi:hypothetical protein ACEN2T_17945 [Pseudomonas sp. W22_MBD1_FP4]|uniref:hypothetical protein n=1 Tax=Pseudomonas sp. W22_MBD1_FP4 TaxID=3240272 RepID=UPI003F9CD5CF